MSAQVKVYAGGETLRKWERICESYTSKTAAFAVMVNEFYRITQEGVEMAKTAAEILQSVVENGRIEQLKDGSFNPESIEIEVEFEARERGLDNSEEIAQEAVKLAS